MYMNGATSNVPPVTMSQQMPAAPKAHPGVIGERPMQRHNSVSSSSVGSNLYDMMLRNSGQAGLLNDPRISVSPPMHSALSTNGGGGRSACVDSSTQTDDNSSWEFPVRTYIWLFNLESFFSAVLVVEIAVACVPAMKWI
jgi:hypothetical protein